MRAITASELLETCGGALGILAPSVAEDLIKPALRRAVFLLAPCSTADLISFVAAPLDIYGDMREAIEQALVEMIAYGDILEMKRLESDPWDAPPYLLRPAPPSFVLRANGDAIILGVSGASPSALTAELDEQVRVEGPVRVLRTGIEPLSAHLKLLGFTQLTEHVWLRTPKACLPEEYVSLWRSQLSKQPASLGAIEGLEILDSDKPGSYYKGRWSEPEKSHTGMFVARRSQRYGAKLWSVVELENGQAVRILDLHAGDDWQRPCDLAWRLQSAIDAVNGTPQRFGVHRLGADRRLDFNSPLPAFAERRLALVASKGAAQGALFTFQLPEDRMQAEVAALETMLWMHPLQKSEGP